MSNEVGLCWCGRPAATAPPGTVVSRPRLARPVPVAVMTACRTGGFSRLVHVRAVPHLGAADFRPAGPALPGLAAGRRASTRTRVQAAFAASGLAWPRHGIDLHLHPHPLVGADRGIDAALAVALLAACDQVPRHMLNQLTVLGGLSPDGSLRLATADLQQRLDVIARHPIRHAVVPATTTLTRVPDGVLVHPAATLRDLANLLTRWPTPNAVAAGIR